MRFFAFKKVVSSSKLTVRSKQGKEAVVGILEPGQFFGEGCLNGHPLRIATTTAVEERVTLIARASWPKNPSTVNWPILV
jgi:CRP-like cAMP-binding protein